MNSKEALRKIIEHGKELADGYGNIYLEEVTEIQSDITVLEILKKHVVNENGCYVINEQQLDEWETKKLEGWYKK